MTTAWQSLAPDRCTPTPLETLCEREAPRVRDVVHRSLLALSAAIERHFPENLFLDLDRLSHTLGDTAMRQGEAAALAQGEHVVRLHSLFGEQTAIRFRYVHDFLYGFDWARWVSRAPSERATVGPFDPPFLAYSEQRARELLQLIARGDPKYGAIDAGTHRNPFPFRRDPDAERVLLRSLAEVGAIPVPAWTSDACVSWDRPFAAIREERARALGLGT